MSDTDLEAVVREIRERLARLEERFQPQATCLSYRDAANRLGVGLTKLKELVARGELRPSRVGRRRMVALSEIERLAAPDEERPAVERRQRQVRWEPIEKRRRR